jgi:hypothetical protein
MSKTKSITWQPIGWDYKQRIPAKDLAKASLKFKYCIESNFESDCNFAVFSDRNITEDQANDLLQAEDYADGITEKDGVFSHPDMKILFKDIKTSRAEEDIYA